MVNNYSSVLEWMSLPDKKDAKPILPTSEVVGDRSTDKRARTIKVRAFHLSSCTKLKFPTFR